MPALLPFTESVSAQGCLDFRLFLSSNALCCAAFPAEDLEEALLFEYEAEEAAGADNVSVVSAVPSSLSHIRSVVTDAAGTHVQTETYVMHIEEDRATSSSWQAAFNAINILCGVGLLTTPYAVAITGLASLLLLVAIGEFMRGSKKA